MTTLARALDDAARRLADAGVAEARRDARVLLCHVLGCPPATLVGHGDRVLDDAQARRYQGLVSRRALREPVSTITGMRAFWSLDLAVTGATLAPRADSETVIEAVLARVEHRAAPLDILDLGTGSGCLLLALLAELPNATGIGVDRSEAATLVARDNSRSTGLGARARFVVGDWATALAGSFDIVVANPPYIPGSAIATLAPEVAAYEPRQALDGGPDGLDAYRAMVPALPRLVRPGGIAALEVGQGQAAAVSALIVGFGGVETARDLAGIDRVVVVRGPEAPKI